MTAICILARLRKTLQDFILTKAAQLLCLRYSALLTLLSKTQQCSAKLSRANVLSWREPLLGPRLLRKIAVKKSRKIRKICQNLFNIQFDDFLTKNIKDEKFVNISNLTIFNKLKNLLNLIENSNFAI